MEILKYLKSSRINVFTYFPLLTICNPSVEVKIPKLPYLESKYFHHQWWKTTTHRATFGKWTINIFKVWKNPDCWHGPWQNYSQIILEPVLPCGPGPSWLTWFHWRVRLFSQGLVLLTPPTLARWARDSAWRPGWTPRVTSSQSSCAWLVLRCRAARIWADPHSPRTALPVQQSHSGQCLPLISWVTTCGNCLFPHTHSVHSL